MKKVRAEQPNLILVDAGDTIQGSFVETFKHEAVSPMMLGLNALNYDVWVMGNHEFDFGLPVLATPLKQFRARRWRAISSGTTAALSAGLHHRRTPGREDRHYRHGHADDRGIRQGHRSHQGLNFTDRCRR
ncbi:hypothetical protein M8494_37710 [Serratia ureilytica]